MKIKLLKDEKASWSKINSRIRYDHGIIFMNLVDEESEEAKEQATIIAKVKQIVRDIAGIYGLTLNPYELILVNFCEKDVIESIKKGKVALYVNGWVYARYDKFREEHLIHELTHLILEQKYYSPKLTNYIQEVLAMNAEIKLR